MYWNEGPHARPHFHARYAGHAAAIGLEGDIIAGTLPGRALSLVAEWAELAGRSYSRTGSALALVTEWAAAHRDELAANWDRARRDEPLDPVDPLP